MARIKDITYFENNCRSVVVPDPIDVAVGARLRKIRKMRGLTQTQLGDAVGLTFQQVQKYERGTNRISASKLVRFAHFLKVPVISLFEGAEEYADNLGSLSDDVSILATSFEKMSDDVKGNFLSLVKSVSVPN